MKYDLEERTLKFSKNVLAFTRKQQKDTENLVIIRQLARSGTSIGANYIEANDGLSTKDFIHRVRIAKKEAKETIYWLNLIQTRQELESERQTLINEANELIKILATIIINTQNNSNSE